jgi:hypothetical protein
VENAARVLGHISLRWLKHGGASDLDRGEYDVDMEGNVRRM